MEILPIPFTWFSTGITSSSSSFSRPGYDSSAVTANWIIGIELELNLKIIGVEAPSGRLSLAISMYERTSFDASSRFQPH